MTIGIFIEDMFDEREFIYPYYRVQEAGFEPLVIAPEVREYKSKAGFGFKADVAAKDVSPDDLAGLIIPGGMAPDRMRRSQEMLALVRSVDEAKKPLAAICHAGWVLISAKVVKGRRLTGYFSILDDLVNAGGDYLDEEVVIDTNLITSRHPGDLPAFMKTFLEALGTGFTSREKERITL